MCLPCQFFSRGAGGSPDLIFRPQKKICQGERQEISQGNIEILLNFVVNPENGNGHPQAATMYFICNKLFPLKYAIQRPLSPKISFGLNEVKISH